MNNHELFDRAKWWLGQGVDLVPIRSRTKALIRGYGARLRHVANEREAWLWFAKLQVNLGVVCGGLMGLTCVDFDIPQAYDGWQAGPGRQLSTLIEKTVRGYHVFFASEPLPSVLTSTVELKASGVVMAAPSIHPSGQRYEIVAPAPIAHLSPAEVDTYFPFVSALFNPPDPLPQLPELPRHTAETFRGNDVLSRIKAAWPVSEEARQLTDLHGQEGHFYGRCPFHEDKQPSLWVDDEAGIWGCRSPSCPTNAKGHAHDVIDLRMWAKHLSSQDAIRELASECLPPLQRTHNIPNGYR
jgi:hypothetical protein